MKEREIKEKITFAKQQQMDCVKLLKKEQWPVLCPVSVMKMFRWKDEKTPKMKTRVCTETGHNNTGLTSGILDEVKDRRRKTVRGETCGSSLKEKPWTHKRPGTGARDPPATVEMFHTWLTQLCEVEHTAETENRWESRESCRTEFTVRQLILWH